MKKSLYFRDYAVKSLLAPSKTSIASKGTITVPQACTSLWIGSLQHGFQLARWNLTSNSGYCPRRGN